MVVSSTWTEKQIINEPEITFVMFVTKSRSVLYYLKSFSFHGVLSECPTRFSTVQLSFVPSIVLLF